MTTTTTDRRAWLSGYLVARPLARGALAALVATPAGGWPETRQARQQLREQMPAPWERGGRQWQQLTDEDLLAFAQGQGYYIHPNRLG